MQPLLAKGQSGGRSIIVMTDWMAEKMHDLGYVQNLDPAGIPNVEANIRDNLKNVSFDPGRKYSVPWQSGMTGLIVNTQLAPNVHSISDLFDPQYKGKVEMLTEMRDTVPLVMKADGIDPANATEQDWLDTIDKLKQAVASGQIRRFTGNDYTRDMANGDVAAIIGWSGDAVQLQADNPNIEFRMPTEGCILWSDNMEIPVGAPNPTAAEAWMNYVYDPKNQAPIAAYNSYVTPVDGVRELFQTSNPDLVNDPLIFPTDQFTSKCTNQPNLTGQEEQTVTQGVRGRPQRLEAERLFEARRRRVLMRNQRIVGSPPPPHSIWAARPGDPLADPLLRRAPVLHGAALAGVGDLPPVPVRLELLELQRRAQRLRHAVHAGVRVLGRGDGPRPADRLSARLRDRLPRRPLEERDVAGGDRPVLHHLPDPDPRLGDDPVRQRVRREHAADVRG